MFLLVIIVAGDLAQAFANLTGVVCVGIGTLLPIAGVEPESL